MAENVAVNDDAVIIVTLPVTLQYQEEQPTQSMALKRELAIKALSRKAKEALIESVK